MKSSDVTQTEKGKKRNDTSSLAFGFLSSSELLQDPVKELYFSLQTYRQGNLALLVGLGVVT